MTYIKEVDNYISTLELIQDANTIDGGEFEEMNIIIHQVPIGNQDTISSNDFFVVLKTNQWALGYPDIDKFAEYLKKQIENKLI